MLKKVFDNFSPFSLVLFTMVLLYLPRLIFDIIGGISRVTPWQLAIFYVPALLFIYYLFNKLYEGIEIFLILLFFSFMLYPTISYYLYENNPDNYHISSEFQVIEKLLAEDKLKYQIPIEDLEFIKTELKESNTDFPKTFCTPEPILIDSKYVFAINSSKSKISITKGDSLKTEFIVENYPQRPEFYRPNNELILALDREIQYFRKLQELVLLNTEGIPFSEFWVESITSFTSGHIQAARNLPKMLNAIQILSILFISTIIINTINSELSLKRKKRKKKRKKKKG
jgi:hypothetical protein